MKSTHNDLDRLLRSAAKAPGRPLVELNHGLQNRVLAQLRATSGIPGASRVVALTALWWRGALGLCSVAAVAVALTVLQSPVEQDPYTEAENVSLEAVGLALN
jgi:hypothetical protein